MTSSCKADLQQLRWFVQFLTAPPMELTAADTRLTWGGGVGGVKRPPKALYFAMGEAGEISQDMRGEGRERAAWAVASRGPSHRDRTGLSQLLGPGGPPGSEPAVRRHLFLLLMEREKFQEEFKKAESRDCQKRESTGPVSFPPL